MCNQYLCSTCYDIALSEYKYYGETVFAPNPNWSTLTIHTPSALFLVRKRSPKNCSVPAAAASIGRPEVAPAIAAQPLDAYPPIVSIHDVQDGIVKGPVDGVSLTKLLVSSFLQCLEK